jgi:hypothetical protein
MMTGRELSVAMRQPWNYLFKFTRNNYTYVKMEPWNNTDMAGDT